MGESSATRPLTNVLAATESAGAVKHVYIHWPFCARKCPYCDFNSHAGRDAEQQRYADALIAEARTWAGRVRAATVFVGGGTPTYVDADGLERYLGGVRDALGLDDVSEWTIEANPGSLDRAKVRALRRVGVNRVSLGVQSFDDRHLKTLGRIHDAGDAVRGIELLREGGLPRFSLDLMLAVPGQGPADQERDIRRAIDLDPEHISAYVLTFEEGTAFTDLMRQGRLPAPDAERELAHLHRVITMLDDAGYERYEISNFAKAGAECLHNMAYWRNDSWIGIGAGAHSHVDGLRWANVSDPAVYALRVEESLAPTDWTERVDAPTRAFEHMMMGLRLAEGIDLRRVASATGVDFTERAELQELIEHELATYADGRLVLTPRGFDVANAVIQRFQP